MIHKLITAPKVLPRIKSPKKDEPIILGLPLDPKSQADLLEKKINELEKKLRMNGSISGIVEKLDAHNGFLMLKTCFSQLQVVLLLENQ